MSEETLQERKTTHGSFEKNAKISQTIKAVFRVNDAHNLSDVHREALEMIALKLSRILSGHADFEDHWEDISGYALLAKKACKNGAKP